MTFIPSIVLCYMFSLKCKTKIKSIHIRAQGYCYEISYPNQLVSKIIHLDDIVCYADCYCSFVIVIVNSGG